MSKSYFSKFSSSSFFICIYLWFHKHHRTPFKNSNSTQCLSNTYLKNTLVYSLVLLTPPLPHRSVSRYHSPLTMKNPNVTWVRWLAQGCAKATTEPRCDPRHLTGQASAQPKWALTLTEFPVVPSLRNARPSYINLERMKKRKKSCDPRPGGLQTCPQAWAWKEGRKLHKRLCH